MQTMYSSDVSETKIAALFYLIACFCNDGVGIPSSNFARFCSVTASTEDLICWLELPEPNRADCQRWKISDDEWYAGLRQALYQRIVEAMGSESEYGVADSVIYGRAADC